MIVLGAILIAAVIAAGAYWARNARLHRSSKPTVDSQARAVEVLAKMSEWRQAGGVDPQPSRFPDGTPLPPLPPSKHAGFGWPEIHLSRRAWFVLGAAALVGIGGLAGLVTATLRPGSNRTPALAPSASPPATPLTIAPTTTTSTPSTIAPAEPARSGSPVLSALEPDAGQPGDVITVTGSGLMSADGLIVAMFGQAQTRIVCPTQTTCRMTVPPQPPQSSGTVEVTVTTRSGSSNAMGFRYTGG
jgi:hypothetical protein